MVACSLSDACRGVLRGEEQLWLRRESPASKGRAKRSGKSGSSAATAFASAADRELWDALRELRMALAKAQDVPPYVVFHDATLAEMVRQRPMDREALATLSGIGERKLAAYGEDFLQVIRSAGSPALC